MKLYALLDETSMQARGWSIERFVGRACERGAEILQYRNKSGDVDTIRSRLEDIVSLFPGRVIVNDHPELAPICGGVHLGQEDIVRYGTTMETAVERLRETIGQERWLGLSTHNKEEIVRANLLDLDYIGLGACRATTTKEDANVLGCEKVAELASLSAHPVAAIGGVKPDDRIDHVTWLVVGSALYED
ncbi:thiamine phosphate synthase [Hydrogenimonas urashimensis]|uniref:thiamine phosphate synthase n=1 Tax=Hydrogenimonas urashimensis TaxID=2740515 RepID=UPI00191606F8|nr:thiamine phosphate synthase [Hydrogenimonas urashimensis]